MPFLLIGKSPTEFGSNFSPVWPKDIFVLTSDHYKIMNEVELIMPIKG